MELSNPISVICGHCFKEYSSCTIIFHQKKQHPELQLSFTPDTIQCSRCLEKISIANSNAHYLTCSKRLEAIKEIGETVEEATGETRSICRCCGRKFFHDRILRHQNACEIASKKRSCYNVSKKRMPLDINQKNNIRIRKRSANRDYANSKWQKQHINLLQKLRGEDTSTNVDEYIVCPYCSRNFCMKSSEKHIDICKKNFENTKYHFPAYKKKTELERENMLKFMHSNSVKNIGNKPLLFGDTNLSITKMKKLEELLLNFKNEKLGCKSESPTVITTSRSSSREIEANIDSISCYSKRFKQFDLNRQCTKCNNCGEQIEDKSKAFSFENQKQRRSSEKSQAKILQRVELRLRALKRTDKLPPIKENS